MAELIKKTDTLNQGREKLNEAITDAETAKVVSEQADDKATQALAKSESTQTQLDTIVIDGDSSVEAAQARVSTTGTAYGTLKQRLDTEYEEVTSQLAQTVVYSGDNKDVFIPPIQEDIHSYFTSGNAFQSGNDQNLSDLVYLFENLADQNNDYVEKRIMGRDSSGGRNFYVYTYTPNNFTKTVILGSGMHGGEKLAVISLYNFLKLLCENWREYPQLAYIRNNIRLVVMPMQNPTGLHFNSRENANSVDINRNFDYKWGDYVEESSNHSKGSAPNSEIETQYIVQILNEYSDAIAYLDLHNMGAGDRTYAEVMYFPKYLYFPNKEYQELAYAVANKNIEINATDNPSSFNFAAKEFEMISLNPEYIPGVVDEAYGSADMTYALKYFANIIIRTCVFHEKKLKIEKLEPRIVLKSWYPSGYSTAHAIPLSSYGEITKYSGSVPVEFNGYAKITFNFTLHADTQDDNPQHFFTPVIYQRNSATVFKEIGKGATIDTYKQYFENYCQGTQRQIITVVALIPINQFEGNIDCKLYAYTTGAECKIMRMTRILELIPTDNQIEATRYLS